MQRIKETKVDCKARLDALIHELPDRVHLQWKMYGWKLKYPTQANISTQEITMISIAIQRNIVNWDEYDWYEYIFNLDVSPSTKDCLIERVWEFVRNKASRFKYADMYGYAGSECH
jgi:hypothetical protein